MDNLEQFIKDNRENLDKYESPETTWRGIKAGLNKKRTIVPAWFYAAALFIVILGTAITLYAVLQNKSNNYSLGNSVQPALKETEAYYNSLVNTLYLEAKPLLTGQPEIALELRTDMAQLDSICADIKKDLKDNVANQEVIEALIQNYRIKLQLLEDMLNMLKQNENTSEKTKSHEL
jgi:CHASE3 domain sensor protein